MPKARRFAAAAFIASLTLFFCSCAQDRQSIFPEGRSPFARFRPKPKTVRVEEDLPVVMPEVTTEGATKKSAPLLAP